jgi:hypothetical protein
MATRKRGAAAGNQPTDKSIQIVIDGVSYHPTPYMAGLIRNWINLSARQDVDPCPSDPAPQTQ